MVRIRSVHLVVQILYLNTFLFMCSVVFIVQITIIIKKDTGEKCAGSKDVYVGKREAEAGLL